MRNRWLIAFAVAGLVACILAPPVLAKFRMTMALGNASPRVGQRVTVIVRTDRAIPDGDFIRLIAVAPDKGWYDVVGRVTGDSSFAQADIPHDGYEIKLVRVAPRRWRALAHFTRPGRWRLVVPNPTSRGFMIPPPLMHWVVVSA